METLELWGGHECTLNRLKDRYLDQSVLAGHDDETRILSDIGKFADLGVKALRYPVLWEKIAPEKDAAPDYDPADRRLEEMRRLYLLNGRVFKVSDQPKSRPVDPPAKSR